MNAPRITVLVATFRRPVGLERALRSIAAQRLEPHRHLHAIVANNDPADPAPREIVARVASETGLAVELVDAADRGVAHARNRALAAAEGKFDLIAFLDDDEEAPEGWLAALLATKARFGADVVTGGIVPRFDAEPPRWAIEGRFFARPERATGTVRPWAFTGNVLFDASLLARLPGWFDGRFTQGEDRHFFARLAATGAKIVWCAEDPPVEHVPAERVDPAWLARRMRAIGRSVTAIERDTPRAAFAVTRNLAKGIAWIAIGACERVVGMFAGDARRVQASMHVAYGAGLVEGSVGSMGSAGSIGSSPRS
jgi:glycosyltransferase involved in cell wall biosynthesis